MYLRESIILFSLLWLHVKTQDTLDALIAANTKFSTESNGDQIEYNEEISKLETARSLTSDTMKKEVIKTFKTYQQQRKKLINDINSLLPNLKDRPDFILILNKALNERNVVKKFALEWASEELMGLNVSSSPSSLPDPLSKLMQPGGFIFSPYLQNQIYAYSQIPTAVSENDKKKNLLETLLENVQFFDDSEEWLNILEWV